jgi:teichuronic acid biosynthesis glycosyltransferase TuaC
MRLLIVCSKNSGRFAPFVEEQADSLRKQGVRLEFFGVEGKGWHGYLQNRKRLLSKIAIFNPHIIHAHYGLSGLLANTQRTIPVVTTYHGSDINQRKVFWISKIAMCLSKHNIFVSQKNLIKAGLKRKVSLIPCGVDIDFFKPYDKNLAREKMNLSLDGKYILFAGSFNNPVKNAYLAHKSIDIVKEATLVELKGYTREQVLWLMNAVDACLMTSHSEGSPQFIKEALACNCPVVSVNVGDVSEVLGDTIGCFVTERNPEDVAEKLNRAINRKKKIEGRERLLELKLDNQDIAKRIIKIYEDILK